MYVGVTRQGLPGAGLVPQSPKKQKRVIQTAQPCRSTAIYIKKQKTHQKHEKMCQPRRSTDDLRGGDGWQ